MLSSFIILVMDRFGFLERDFGFCRVTTHDRLARWENNNVFVQVHFDSDRSHEVGAEIGQLKVLSNGKERPFDFGEVARMAGKSWDQFRVLQGHDDKSLNNALTELTNVLKQHCQTLLRNETIAFADLAKQREQECSDYATERDFRLMMARADKAWQEHDYQTIVDLYGPHQYQLSPAQVKRYEIALKQMANG